MSWNYRVIKHQGDFGPYSAIHAVYYVDDKPDSWSETPATVLSDDVLGLKSDLSLMIKALEKPSLVIVNSNLVEVS